MAFSLAKMGFARSGPHKVRGVEHHISNQAAGTPVPTVPPSIFHTDFVSGYAIRQPLIRFQAIII